MLGQPGHGCSLAPCARKVAVLQRAPRRGMNGKALDCDSLVQRAPSLPPRELQGELGQPWKLPYDHAILYFEVADSLGAGILNPDKAECVGEYDQQASAESL